MYPRRYLAVLGLALASTSSCRGQEPQSQGDTAPSRQAALEVIDRARPFVRSGDYLAALRVIDGAARLGVHDTVIDMKRGVIHALVGAYEPALHELTAYLRECPGDGLALYYKGFVLKQLERPAAALESLREAKRQSCDEPDLDGRIRDLEAEVKELALKHSALASKAQMERGDWWEKITLELRLGDLTRAETTAAQWATANPEDPTATWGLGIVSGQRGDWLRALEIFQKMRDGGFQDDADRGIATVAACQGRWEEMGRMARRVLVNNPNDGRMRRLCMLAFLLEGDYSRFEVMRTRDETKAGDANGDRGSATIPRTR